MGPVRTTITVLSRDAYTEVNEVKVGQMPRTDLVVARRISDCGALDRPAVQRGEVAQGEMRSEGESLTNADQAETYVTKLEWLID